MISEVKLGAQTLRISANVVGAVDESLDSGNLET